MHAAVIGSGLHGLAAAIRLATSGARVTLFEAHEAPGAPYVHRIGRYTFDVGPTVITAPHGIEELFLLAGRRMEDYVELLPVKPFYRLHWTADGTRFDDDGDVEHVTAQLRALHAGDAGDCFQLAARARRVFDTVAGGNPFTAAPFYTPVDALEREWSVWFPRGGSGALVTALVTLLRELGGELSVSCAVRGVRDAGDAHLVTTDARGEERFDLVVESADLARPIAPFVLCVGTTRDYAERAAHHTVVFAPPCRGLHDIYEADTLPADGTLYLHAPHVTDSSLAPHGHGAFHVLAPAPRLGEAPVDWNAVCESYGDRILEALEAVLPDLRRHVSVRHHITPADLAGPTGTSPAAVRPPAQSAGASDDRSTRL